MAIVEGTTSLPAVQGVADGGATYDGTNLWLFRADNATAKNLRVALYAADGSVLIGAKTSAGSMPVVIASDQAVIPFKVDQTTPGTTDRVTVSSVTNVITVAPVVSTSPAYTAGDNVGAKLTLASAVRISGGGGVIQSLILADKGKQSAALDVVFFNANPGSTFTDNTAQTLSDADLLTIIGVVPILATDYSAFVDNSVATKLGLGLSFKAVGSTSIYACIVVRTTPTYTATSDLQLIVSILSD